MSKEELMQGVKGSKLFISKEEIDKLFDQLDSNKSNALDYTEFVAAAVNK